ncbi:MAG: ATP-binding cassette domain-containing protein [Verrucomicrobia bacterium]|nr:ATP-binding cassette domain-containing protein [Verrucomicrobiota bacterium]
MDASIPTTPTPKIEIRHLDMAFGPFVLMRDINAAIRSGEIFVIIGGSGCGKSTLLRHLIGFLQPARGDILYDGRNFTAAGPDERERRLRQFGVLFQGGALWSSMTLAENVALPLAQYSPLSQAEIADIVRVKLALVGLKGFEDYYPAELSGGMRKRAGLARAIALDPEILFFDEPSAGLDPLTSQRLDALILELRDSLGATVVVVTHELDSIFTIGDRAIFLDARTRTATAQGHPRDLRDHSPDPGVRAFLSRRDVLEGIATPPAPAAPDPIDPTRL